MTRLERIFAWLGGVLFVASLVLTLWWYFIFLGRLRSPAGWPPLVFDAVLFTVFAFHHTVFARDGVKAAMRRVVPERLLRSVYVWTASVLLTLLCLLWQPIGGTMYHDTGIAAFLHAAIQGAGFSLIFLAVRAIDPLDLSGIKHVMEAEHPPRSSNGAKATDMKATETLQVTGPYQLVRHPLYLGWMLFVFGAANMSVDRFTFAVISSLYLVIAIPFEERSLVAVFGDQYSKYQDRVRWRVIPYVY
jgi:protein-S-isoprenylcysteine O-methyltransferase Ste14